MLHCPPAAITSLKILRRAIDARKKPAVKYIYNVAVSLRSAAEEATAAGKMPQGHPLPAQLLHSARALPQRTAARRRRLWPGGHGSPP